MNTGYQHQVDIGGGVKLANITMAEASMMCEQFLKQVYQIRNAVDSMQSPEVITNTAEYRHIETCIRLMARVAEQCESSLMTCESHMNEIKHLIPILPIRFNIPVEDLDHIRTCWSKLQLGGGE